MEAAAPLGAPPPPVEGDLTLEAVRERWRHVQARVFDRSYPTGTMIRPASPAGVTGDTIRLAYPQGRSGYLKGLSSAPGRLALVESAASEIMGRPVKVSLASSSGPAGGGSLRQAQDAGATRPEPADAGPAPAADTLNDPGVRKVMDRFEGQIVRVDRAAGGSPEDDTGGGRG
jgi:hypothetical protein